MLTCIGWVVNIVTQYGMMLDKVKLTMRYLYQKHEKA